MTDQTKQTGTSGQQDETTELEAELQSEIDAVDVAEGAVEDSLQAVSSELAILKEALARAQADYQNLLRRVERDKVEMTSFITANVVAKMLPFVDNLERAVASVPDDLVNHAWIEGVKAMHAAILKQLETMGVKPFVSVGHEVDTERHEVMSQAPGEAGKIVAEFEKGYTLHDRVIRHAKVVVGSGE